MITLEALRTEKKGAILSLAKRTAPGMFACLAPSFTDKTGRRAMSTFSSTSILAGTCSTLEVCWRTSGIS